MSLAMSAPIRVLHYGTCKETCGIADYTASLVAALDHENIRSTIHPVERRALKYMSNAEIRQRITRFCQRARSYDLVHVQHEFSFFTNGRGPITRSLSHFAALLRQLRALGKPVVVTFHTEPSFLHGLRRFRLEQKHGL